MAYNAKMQQKRKSSFTSGISFKPHFSIIYYTIFIILCSSFSLSTCALQEIRSLWNRGWRPEGNFRFNLGLAEFLCTDAMVTCCQANIVAACASEEVADISFRAGKFCRCWSMLTWTLALIGTHDMHKQIVTVAHLIWWIHSQCKWCHLLHKALEIQSVTIFYKFKSKDLFSLLYNVLVLFCIALRGL